MRNTILLYSMRAFVATLLCFTLAQGVAAETARRNLRFEASSLPDGRRLSQSADLKSQSHFTDSEIVKATLVHRNYISV